jgi:hypothetical protein
LLRVHLAALRLTGEPWLRICRALVLQARLDGAGVYLEQGETLLSQEGYLLPESHALLELLSQLRQPVFLACSPDLSPYELLPGLRCLTFLFSEPDHAGRRRLWLLYAAQTGCPVSDTAIEALANRFVLTPGQIQEAVATALDHHTLTGDSDKELPDEYLLAAARAQ